MSALIPTNQPVRRFRGLAFRLACHILLFTTLAGFGTAAYIIYRVKTIALENTHNTLTSLADSSARQIDTELRNCEDFAKAIAATLGQFRPGGEETLRYLQTRVEETPTVFGVAVGFAPQAFGRPTGHLIPYACHGKNGVSGRLFTPQEVDYSVRPWYVQARDTGKGFWMAPYASADSGITIVSYGYPFYDRSAAHPVFAGAVVVDLDLRVVERITSAARLSGKCQLLLIDRSSGAFVAHPDPEQVRRGARLEGGDGADRGRRDLVRRLLRGEEGAGALADWEGGGAAFCYYLPLQSNQWTLAVVYFERDLMERLYDLILHTVGIVLVAFLLLALLVRRTARKIAAPLEKLEAAAREIARGNLHAPLPELAGADEIARLCGSVREMAQGLRGLVQGIKASTVRLVSASTQIAATSSRQEETMNAFAGEVAQAAAAVAEISASARVLSQEMERVNGGAGEAAAQAGEGRQSLQELEGTIRALTDATHAMAGKLELIRQSAESVSGIVEAIAGVAEQTNLLSLNASIEAEKAGEYGKGFSVVAREIRRLADQTAVATLEITDVMKGMQSSVEAGVAELELFSETVERCAGRAGEIGGDLGGVIRQVTGLRPSFLQVNEGMAAQSQGAAEISEAMRRLREGAAEATESMVQLNSATEQLREAAALLREETGRFQTE